MAGRRTTGRGQGGGGRGRTAQRTAAPNIRKAAVAGNQAGGRAFGKAAAAGAGPRQARAAGMRAAGRAASQVMGRKTPAGSRDTTGRGNAADRGG